MNMDTTKLDNENNKESCNS